MARGRRMLNAKKKGEPLISDDILRKLASLNLPPSVLVYEAVLEKLLKDA
jgi:hypothetical protein